MPLTLSYCSACPRVKNLTIALWRSHASLGSVIERKGASYGRRNELEGAGPNRADPRCCRRCGHRGALAALAWMIPHFIAQPATRYINPGDADGDVIGLRSPLEGREIVKVPFGETVVLDDLDWGMKYDLEASSYLQEDWDSKTEAERQAAMESEGWDEEIAPFSAASSIAPWCLQRRLRNGIRCTSRRTSRQVRECCSPTRTFAWWWSM